MTTIGFDKPLYILPFDHRGSFQTKMFGWKGTLTAEQTAEIAADLEVVAGGGIDPETARLCIQAGANVQVAGSSFLEIAMG